MHLNRTFVAVAASAALVFSAIPAHAQRRGGDNHGARRGGGDHESRQQAAPRPAARGEVVTGQRINRAAPAPRGGVYGNQGINRAAPAPRFEDFNRGAQAQRPNVARSYSRGAYSPRPSYNGGYSYRGDRDDRGRSYNNYRGGYNYRGRYSYGGGYSYRGGYGSHRSFFSFYSFRPRLNLGFGLWLGYPIAYPYDDYYTPDVYVTPAPYPSDSYAYQQAPPPSDYGYDAPSSYDDPSQQADGGISLEITPDGAAVFVDGTYVGTAGTFSPAAQPLGLTPGRHRIEIRAAGYRTMAFDADVIAGQVLPYRGTLR